jgi:hypothetical protein
MDGDRAFAHKYVHFGERGAFAIRGGHQRHRKRGVTQQVCDTENIRSREVGL